MSCAAERMLAIDGPVARRLDGFEPRPEQVQMAAAVDSVAAAVPSSWAEVGHLEVLFLLVGQEMFGKSRLV